MSNTLPEPTHDVTDEPEMRALWPQALVDMLDVIAASLARELGDQEQARRLAALAIRELAHYFGGRMTYLPRGDRLERALRDKAIWDAHDGRRTSVLELAARYRLTEQQIYAILREQRALHVRRVQPGLFEEEQ